MHAISVASFNEVDKAEALKCRLEEEGIKAEVYDESKWQKFWFLSKSLAGEKVRVDEKDFERAKEVLKGLDASEDVLRDAVKCPECDSPRVEYPRFTRKFITPTLVEIFSTLNMTEKRFYCEECHHTWSAEPKVPPPKSDILGWPMPE